MFAAGKTAAVSGAAPDDKFNYVTMLLHGDGTNGAQNNTFLDSSTNNFTITRNGNTTQGSFSPYGSNWGAYFNSGANISSSTWNSAGVFGTSDFTVECWVYAIAAQDSNQVIFTNNAYPSTTGFYFRYTGSGSTNFTVNTGTTTLITASGGWSLNTWHHIAVTRASGTMTLWIDGVSRGTSSFTNNCSDGMQYIGRTYDTGSNYYMQGYISNFRITKSAALYTTTFTPSTTPLTTTVSSGTVSLLCLQSNRFIDNSSNAYALTANSSPSVQRFNPFGTSTAYSTSVIGGSGYFDGTGDYLTTPSSSALGFGTGDFTIECWTYLRDSNALYVFDMRFSSGADTYVYITASTLEAAVNGVGLSVTGVNFLNNWAHIAIVRASGTVKIYVNGVQKATDTSSGSIANSGIAVGARYTGSESFNGYISNFRIVKGTAVYTSAFTPPTAPLTAITNTSLLLNYINGAIIDNAMMNDLETVGNAQISTSVVKFGTGSISNVASASLFLSQEQSFGTGDFTWEAWIYPTAYGSGTGSNQSCIFADVVGVGTSNVQFNLSSIGRFIYYNGVSTIITTTATATLNAWSHVALVRSNGTSTIYLDGTSIGSATDSANIYLNSIGGFNPYSATNSFRGYLDEVRVTKGYARYTANFTAPTAAFSDTGPY